MLRKGSILLLQSLILVLLLSCSQKNHAVAEKSAKKDKEFSFIQHDFVETFNSEDSIVFEATKVGSPPIKLILILEGERSVVSVEKTRLEIDFNYYYDSDIEWGLKQIKLYKHKNSSEVLMLFPAVTEEFATYQVVKFNDTDKSFSVGHLEIDSHEPFSLDSAKLEFKSNACIFTNGNKSYTAQLNLSIDDNQFDQKMDERGNDSEEYGSLSGEWNLNCYTELTEFSIQPSGEVFISLESNNAIYITGTLKPNGSNHDTYDLFFKRVESKQNYYPEPVINGDQISKERSIATITIINENGMELKWKGLFNTSKGKLEFFENFLFLKENNNSNPIILKRCG